MEEKESTVSGSMSDSGSDSPSPVTSYTVSAAVAAAASYPQEPFNINETGVGTLAAFSGPMTASEVANNTTTAPATSGGMSSGAGGQGTNGGDLSGKKKRGRPRKYDSEGNLIIRSPPPGFSLSPASPNSTTSSRKKKSKALGPGELFGSLAAWDFTPHVVTVNTGEDVAGEILAYSQKGCRGICVLSANGAVSNAAIRQPGASGGLLTYEGRFEILSLTGSYVITEAGGSRNKTGGLTVSLAGPDGRVIGGGVAGILTAASPIQMVLGSFLPIIPKPQKRKYERKTVPSASSKLAKESAFRGGQEEQQQPQIPNAVSFNPRWAGSEPEPEPESKSVISPDINVSAPSE